MTFTGFLALNFVAWVWIIGFTLAINGLFKMFYYVFEDDNRLKIDFKHND